MESPLLQYKKDRAAEYPSVEEQLDMIWHELNTKGHLSKSYETEEGITVFSTWYGAVKGVKESNPKP
jgi:hypothetical protein